MRLLPVALLAVACGSTTRGPEPLPKSRFVEGADCNFELGPIPREPTGSEPRRLEVLDAGRAPRQPLRRGGTLAGPQAWAYRTETGVKVERPDDDSGDWLKHSTAYQLRVQPDGRRLGGAITSFRIEGAEVTRADERDGPEARFVETLRPAILNRPRADIGTVIQLTFDGEGRLLDLAGDSEEPPFTDDNLQPELVELPTEPLGVGARWVVASRSEATTTKTTFEVIDRRDQVATLRVVTTIPEVPRVQVSDGLRNYFWRDEEATETWSVDASTPVIAYQGRRTTTWVNVHCHDGRMRFEREQERVDATFAPAP